MTTLLPPPPGTRPTVANVRRYAMLRPPWERGGPPLAAGPPAGPPRAAYGYVSPHREEVRTSELCPDCDGFVMCSTCDWPPWPAYPPMPDETLPEPEEQWWSDDDDEA